MSVLMAVMMGMARAAVVRVEERMKGLMGVQVAARAVTAREEGRAATARAAERGAAVRTADEGGESRLAM